MPGVADGWRWLDGDAWDRLVTASPERTFFHTRGWNEAIAKHVGRFRAAALGTSLADGTEVVLPMLLRRGLHFAGPLRNGVSSHPNAYGGPLATGRALTAADWKELQRRFDRLPLRRLHCLGNPMLAAEPTMDHATHRAAYHTHVIDLPTLPDDPTSTYSASCRRALRKAERSGVVVEPASPADLDAYYAMYEDSMRRWGKDPATGRPLALLRDVLALPGAELLLARLPDGQPVAGAMFLAAGTHYDYWHGAMLKAHAEVRPSNAVHHFAIQRAREAGHHIFDFNASGGLEGVEAFKESFGARSVEVTTWKLRRGLFGRMVDR